jgi:hypothetical protein
MPPQQPDRLLDLVDDGLDFGAHGRDLVVQDVKCNAFVIASAAKQSRCGVQRIAAFWIASSLRSSQ